tara:strand:+ start:3988 stop:4935 length:948 start_codon:yes stop_codon:yes gene_type:complete
MNRTKTTLLILEELEIEDGILRTTLFTILEDKPAKGRNWSDAYNFSKKLGFITEKKNDVFISSLGKNILKIRKGERDKELLDYIFKECIFGNTEFIKVKEFLDKFHQYKNELILENESVEQSDNVTINLLGELKIISFDRVWKIRNDVKNMVSINRNHKGKRKLSQDEIEKIKEEQKRVGDCAEKLSLAFEERLFARTKMDKTQIEHTSDFDDSAGYDIKSKWRKKNQERESFIEVKGRKYDEDSFIISNNELNVAKMKGENYVIYFWKNLFEVLDSGCKSSSLEPTAIIRNPIRKLKINLCDNCLEYRIRLRDL